MFTTGQVVEGAVNFAASNAVGGETTTGDSPNLTQNQSNLSLPALQPCAAPIGAKWIANITNWICYVIDGAGLQYLPGNVIQDPLRLLNAIIALIKNNSTNIYCQASLPDTSNGRPCVFKNTGTSIIQIGSGSTIDLIPPGAIALFDGTIWALQSAGPHFRTGAQSPTGSAIVVPAGTTATIAMSIINNDAFATYDGTKFNVNATGEYTTNGKVNFTYNPTGAQSNINFFADNNGSVVINQVNHFLDTLATGTAWAGEADFSATVSLTAGDQVRVKVTPTGSDITVNAIGFGLYRIIP